MRKKKLAVITTHFNPLNKSSLRDNYIRFLSDMKTWDVDVFSAEVVWGNTPFPTQDAFIQIRASKKHFLWQKERLLNLIVEKLPRHYRKIAWVDADVLFLNRNWVQLAQLAMKHFTVAQLFSEILWLNSEGQVEDIVPASGFDQPPKRMKARKNNWGNPGMAFVADRSVFPLYEYCILGGGDSYCVSAWGRKPDFNKLAPELQHFNSHYNLWAERAQRKVKTELALIRGQIVHLYHGDLPNRKYIKRWDTLKRFNYNPQRDIEIDPGTGLLAFSKKADRKLVREVRNYFQSRLEV